jgi:hypothetical protein
LVSVRSIVANPRADRSSIASVSRFFECSQGSRRERRKEEEGTGRVYTYLPGFLQMFLPARTRWRRAELPGLDA